MARNVTRRDFVGASASAALGFAIPSWKRLRPNPSFDVVILGGTILDGTGGPARLGDIGIVGDTIMTIGTIAPDQGRHVVDASGLHVAPGFLDVHTHSDGDILDYPTADSRLRQGITTEVTGNCGSSAAPRAPRAEEEREEDEREGVAANWTDIASYFTVLEDARVGTNQVLLVGQGTLRRNAIGAEDRRLTDEEMHTVLDALEAALDQGAFGLSTGLEYVPGRYTPTDEIVTMARVVARRGGLYASHIRDEETLLLEAVDEAIEIGRRAGCRVEISHLKAAGAPNWPKQRAALDLIEAANSDGVDVMADAYPYTAYSTGLSIYLPGWAAEGGWERAEARLRDPSDRGRIRDEYYAKVTGELGGFHLLVVASTRTEANRGVVGMSVADIGEQWGVEPVDAALRLLLEESGSVSIIGHGMSPENVERVLAHPLVMVGSDGYSMAPTGRAAETRPHPRSYGTCARVLAHYCRERGIFDLPTAVRKMTSMAADQVGIAGRGRIARSMKADLVVFDAERVQDRATFDDPHRYPIGIPYVLVNGQIVIAQGEPTGVRAGRVLRRET